MSYEKIEIELNKPYTQAMLAKVLGVNQATLIKSKEKYLINLAMYYEFTTERIGPSLIYIFTKKLGEYQKPDCALIQKREEALQNLIINAVKEDCFQTVEDIEIKNKKQLEKLGVPHEAFAHKVKKLFGNEKKAGSIGFIKQVFCRYDKTNLKFILLPSEQEQYYLDLCKKEQERNLIDEAIELEKLARSQGAPPQYPTHFIFEAYENGMTKVLETFKEKYGYYPRYTSMYCFYEENKR